MNKNVKNQLSFRPGQLAEATGLSLRLVYREIKSGNLESVRIGRARLITSASAEKWLSGQQQSKSAA
jgi:excisionase family DNA binding protein